MQIKILKDFGYKGVSFKGGVIHEARHFYQNKNLLFPDSFQIIDGPKSGEIVPKDYCIALPEEKTYTKGEYDSLAKKLTALEQAHEKQVGIWQKRIDELLKENHRLQDEIDAAREGEKVKIPLEVAKAIEKCRTVMSSIDIVTKLDVVNQLFSDYDNSILDALVVIRDFAYKTIDGGRNLLTALVNDYTIEETTKEQAIRYLNHSGAIAKGYSAHDVVVAIIDILEKS